MFVTVATPTFNRAHLLGRLYKSLCEQTHHDFEWLIIDDGSTDCTEKIVKGYQKENHISIRYLRKNNGGKHTAINLAVREAKGELFFIADSDDWLPTNAISTVIDEYIKIKNFNSMAGICGLDAFANGLIVGSGLPIDEIDASPQEIRSRWGVYGDLKEVFRTSVLQEFPFPEIEGENFCPEVLIWNRIGRHYKLRYINKPIYTVEYQNDGITSGITRARMNSPIATMMAYSEWFEDNLSIMQKLKMATNYWRFRFFSHNNTVKISNWGNLMAPLGFLLNIKDRLKFNTISDNLAFFGINKGKS